MSQAQDLIELSYRAAIYIVRPERSYLEENEIPTSLFICDEATLSLLVKVALHLPVSAFSRDRMEYTIHE